MPRSTAAQQTEQHDSVDLGQAFLNNDLVQDLQR